MGSSIADGGARGTTARPDGFRVFGYGSLLWNPGFTVVRRQAAVLRGFRRSFCMRSIHHRGTPEAPGLVLALDREEGASCKGFALEADSSGAGESLRLLRERELVSYAYKEETVELDLEGGGVLQAIAYVVDRAHPQYCGAVPLRRQAEIIARAAGRRGPNSEYLRNTVRAFREMAVVDPEIEELHRLVEELERDRPV